ncbi:hypothetical protein [Aurantimonas sp. 22II-16-19i]|uniref:hypothetical protein n=1 Tax=Aurantimonas sp. 22II-16-19i TaxID=1317114 RepID=UPI00111C24DF|nr:hypothetical protein [Aurantimonas sp. 22II-16-19i]
MNILRKSLEWAARRPAAARSGMRMSGGEGRRAAQSYPPGRRQARDRGIGVDRPARLRGGSGESLSGIGERHGERRRSPAGRGAGAIGAMGSSAGPVGTRRRLFCGQGLAGAQDLRVAAGHCGEAALRADQRLQQHELRQDHGEGRSRNPVAKETPESAHAGFLAENTALVMPDRLAIRPAIRKATGSLPGDHLRLPPSGCLARGVSRAKLS